MRGRWLEGAGPGVGAGSRWASDRVDRHDGVGVQALAWGGKGQGSLLSLPQLLVVGDELKMILL